MEGVFTPVTFACIDALGKTNCVSIFTFWTLYAMVIAARGIFPSWTKRCVNTVWAKRSRRTWKAFLGRNVRVLFRLAARDVRARHVCGAVREHECAAGIPAVIVVDA